MEKYRWEKSGENCKGIVGENVVDLGGGGLFSVFSVKIAVG